MRFESGHMLRQLLGILRDQGRTTASLTAGSCFQHTAASTSGRMEHTLWQVAHNHGSGTSTTRTFHSAALRLTRLHTEVWDESKAPALATSGLPFGSPLPTDPFALAQPEVDAISERLRRSVASSIPSLSQAAEYFFRMGVEGKRLRPTLIMLMASALSSQPPSVESLTVDLRPASEHASEPRRRQQRIAEIAEIMHVASLLHDDVIDEAPTRRGILSLNSKAGNKMAILAGDFLLARASVSLAALRNTAIVELMSQILEHLVSGEVMQMTASQEQVLSMDHYLEKTYCKTASLMANSSRAVAVLGGHTPEVCDMAWGYGKHLGLAFQIVDDILDLTASSSILGKPSHSDIRSGLATAPVLFAAEQQPKLRQLIARRFKHEGDVEMAVQLLEATTGIQQAKDLANHHCAMAAQMIQSLPSPQSEHAIQARNALINITQRVLNRKK